MAKEKRHKATLKRDPAASSLDAFDAILEESRQLRRQMADDLGNEARKFRRISSHFARLRHSTDSDEQSA